MYECSGGPVDRRRRTRRIRPAPSRAPTRPSHTTLPVAPPCVPRHRRAPPAAAIGGRPAASRRSDAGCGHLPGCSGGGEV